MPGIVSVSATDTESLPGYSSSLGRDFASLPDSVKRCLYKAAIPVDGESGRNQDIIGEAWTLRRVRSEWNLNNEEETITFYRGPYLYWIRFRLTGVDADGRKRTSMDK
jgi:hypothetical protein